MDQPREDIWQFQMRLGRDLGRWGLLSVVSGAALALTGNRFWRGIGAQCFGWGAVDGAIGLFGLHGARKKAAESDALQPDVQHPARELLRRILWVNTALDVGYVAGGIALARTRGREDAFWRGSGWGIVVQGGFLFFFDLLHALQLA
jgi:hypothetical protein